VPAELVLANTVTASHVFVIFNFRSHAVCNRVLSRRCRVLEDLADGRVQSARPRSGGHERYRRGRRMPTDDDHRQHLDERESASI